MWHVPQPLDVAAMQPAAALLVGTHDFAAFQSVGSDTAGSVRTISASTIQRHAAPVADPLHSSGRGDADLLAYEVSGDGFLRHMVRAIVGTLVEVGRGLARPGVDHRLAALGPRAITQGRRPRRRGSSSSVWTMINCLHPQGLRRVA